MTIQTALAWYIVAGVIGGMVGIGLEGQRGLSGTAVAWVLCLVTFVRPPSRPRVAGIPVGSRISRDRRLWLGAMPIRMLIVLAAAALVYGRLGDRIGIGFWLALLVFYPIGLALSVTWTLTELKRTD
jgi:hypothetical protein